MFESDADKGRADKDYMKTFATFLHKEKVHKSALQSILWESSHIHFSENNRQQKSN